MKTTIYATAAILALLPATTHADEVTDTLEAAIAAYNDGDIAYALEELSFARDRLMAMQADSFQSFLPEAPEGWTREIDTEMGMGMAMFGGGTGASASYSSADGNQSYKVTMMADSPMVMSMGAMVQNAGAMGMDVERVGRQRVAVNDQQAIALVENRILITIDGSDRALMLAAMESIDFEALAGF